MKRRVEADVWCVTAGELELHTPALPLRVPPVQGHEVSGLDAAGAGQPAAGGAAQRAPLHRHVQTLRVVHRLHHQAARRGGTRVRLLGPEGWPPAAGG